MVKDSEVSNINTLLTEIEAMSQMQSVTDIYLKKKAQYIFKCQWPTTCHVYLLS